MLQPNIPFGAEGFGTQQEISVSRTANHLGQSEAEAEALNLCKRSDARKKIGYRIPRCKFAQTVPGDWGDVKEMWQKGVSYRETKRPAFPTRRVRPCISSYREEWGWPLPGEGREICSRHAQEPNRLSPYQGDLSGHARNFVLPVLPGLATVTLPTNCVQWPA